MSRTIKVLEISSYPPPRAGWGMRVYFLKRELERHGHVCAVLNTGKSRKLRGRDFVPVFNGFDFVWKVFWYRLRGYVVHQHLNGDSPKGFILTCLSLLVSLMTFSRPVITFHAGPVQKYFPQSQAPRLTWLYKFIFTAPRHIICNSDVVKRAIMGYGVPGEKIVPIQAFSKQYLQFEEVELAEPVASFFRRFENVICSYVFFRPEFFIEEMIRAFARLVAERKDVGLMILGSDMQSEPIRRLIHELNLDEHVLIAGDQDHDAFLTILSRSKLYLRTPVKDGVSSSVLEALALGIPVVASENGTRPASVLTYENQNLDDMVQKLKYVLDHYPQVKASVVKPDIPDTIWDEIAVLADAPVERIKPQQHRLAA